LWETITTTYWFIPSLMTLMAIGLSYGLTTLDKSLPHESTETFFWIYNGGVQGARTILSIIAGSMITVAGVSFSIIIVALTLASSQFGPRLLDNFMKDTGNQMVLGTFIGTFVYCLMILSSIGDVIEKAELPNISITFAIALSLASIGVFIFFVHHASSSIQAENVISKVYFELEEAVDRLYPEKLGQELQKAGDSEVKEEELDNFRKNSSPVTARISGYIQAVETESLLKIAKQYDSILTLQYRPGDFVVKGSILVTVWPEDSKNKEIDKKINDAFILGRKRTLQQDPEFAVDQLVEIAVRSLSPGINDPFTAISCIDRLGAALSQLAQRKFPSPYRYDEKQQLRVIADSTTFTGLVDTAFRQIRQYGKTSVAVTVRLLEAIEIVAHYLKNDEQRQALIKHAGLINSGCKELIKEEADIRDIEERFNKVQQVLAPERT